MRLAAHGRSGLVAVGASVVAGYVGYHRWQVRWGATAQEVAEPLPGDDVVDRAWWSATRAITINAAPAQVWPWLVQMGGYTRAGWYSYDWIDNAGRPSANTIVPELQDLTVGDILHAMIRARVDTGWCSHRWPVPHPSLAEDPHVPI